MAPKKLTEADKTSILGLYRQRGETTSTLAERYGVSNSTISRLLKASLPEAEYSALIQQKRSGTDRAVASSGDPTPAPLPLTIIELQPDTSGTTAEVSPAVTPKQAPKLKQRGEGRTQDKAAPVTETAEPDVVPVRKKRVDSRPSQLAEGPDSPELDSAAQADSPLPSAQPSRRRSRSEKAPADPAAATQLSLPEPEEAATEGVERPILKPILASTPKANSGSSPDSAADWDDTVTLDDDYDDDEDDDDEEDEAWDGEEIRATPHMGTLEIVPLTNQVLPQLCYVVVERTSSELVALPLRTFADLGQIPEAEGDSRTLPVFDNHRIARRFSRRNQRVVKVPDGSLLQTTSPYLQAKGITRLLIDGQVFALEAAFGKTTPLDDFES